MADIPEATVPADQSSPSPVRQRIGRGGRIAERVRRYRRDSVPILLIAVLAGLGWQYLPPLFGVPSYIIPALSDVVEKVPWMLQQDDLLFHLGSSFLATVGGFVLGAIIGAGCGYGLGAVPVLKRALAPYILALQISPKVAFAPLFIMWFGYNALPKLIVAILIVFFPILVNTMQSMRTVDRDLVNLARAYNMGRAAIFWKIEFPSSMPSLMAGLRIASTLAVIGVTVGELIAGNVGLGYLIQVGQGQGDTAMVFVAIGLLTAIGIVLYSAVSFIEARVLHYIPQPFD
jgi:NitT/TauT family transport system permease protein